MPIKESMTKTTYSTTVISKKVNYTGEATEFEKWLKRVKKGMVHVILRWDMLIEDRK